MGNQSRINPLFDQCPCDAPGKGVDVFEDARLDRPFPPQSFIELIERRAFDQLILLASPYALQRIKFSVRETSCIAGKLRDRMPLVCNLHSSSIIQPSRRHTNHEEALMQLH